MRRTDGSDGQTGRGLPRDPPDPRRDARHDDGGTSSDDHEPQAPRRAGLDRRRSSWAPAAAARSSAAPSSRRRRRPAPSPAIRRRAARRAVSGSIIVSGSSTVEPISTGVAEAFKAVQPGLQLHDRPGPAPATASSASAPARPTSATPRARSSAEGEADVCATTGIEYVELKVAVRRHHGHDVAGQHAVDLPVASPTCTRSIGPESTGFDDVDRRPGDRHGARLDHDLPGRRPRRSPARARSPAPSTASSSSSSTDIAEARRSPRTQITTRPDYTASANDNAIIEGITGSPTLARLGRLRLRRGERGHGQGARASPRSRTATCVAPTAETIADDSYPISRDLYIYVNKAKAAENPAVAAYVDYYLAEGTISTVLETVPYVNLPADDARRDAGRLGRPLTSAPSSSQTGPDQLGGPAGSLHPRPR